MEAQRLAMDPEEIDRWFHGVTRVIEGIPREFVLNVDETACSGFSDAHEIKVVVSNSRPMRRSRCR
jgi:hypothetical protein